MANGHIGAVRVFSDQNGEQAINNAPHNLSLLQSPCEWACEWSCSFEHSWKKNIVQKRELESMTKTVNSQKRDLKWSTGDIDLLKR